jgi:NAD+ synthase (glutamine-hydrolysing)
MLRSMGLNLHLRDIISTFSCDVNQNLSTAHVLITYTVLLMYLLEDALTMPQPLRFLMAQINPTVGAIESNTDQIIQIIEAHQDTHDLIIFPELVLTGYPPEDLLFRPELFERVERSLDLIQARTTHCHVIVGHPEQKEHCYNTATIFHQGQRFARYHKQRLPNDSIFDEKRYFHPGEPAPCVFMLNGHHIGLCICEDIWHTGPIDQVVTAGASILLCMNASPFDIHKNAQREALLIEHAKRGLFIVYVNLVGGQDELVFDGQSQAITPEGKLYARAPAFIEHLQTITWPPLGMAPSTIAKPLAPNELIYQALCCGLHDYVKKNKFPGVLLGLSGGIDSALTLAIAVDSLGADRVHAVMMPSRFTQTMSVEDALAQLKTLNVQHTTLSIEPAFQALLTTLEPAWRHALPNHTAEENLQARVRGTLLMGLSNKTGFLVLSTSNKSETAVGYSTLYGDMCGGFSPLKDILKTTVYALAHYCNREHPIIPLRVIERPPSAELAENQTDQDSLPDYTTLDAIIQLYMELKLSPADIIARGFEPLIVHQVIALIKRNEYKRKQASIGVKISTCAFGRDWRYPITSEF